MKNTIFRKPSPTRLCSYLRHIDMDLPKETDLTLARGPEAQSSCSIQPMLINLNMSSFNFLALVSEAPAGGTQGIFGTRSPRVAKHH